MLLPNHWNESLGWSMISADVEATKLSLFDAEKVDAKEDAR